MAKKYTPPRGHEEWVPKKGMVKQPGDLIYGISKEQKGGCYMLLYRETEFNPFFSLKITERQFYRLKKEGAHVAIEW